MKANKCYLILGVGGSGMSSLAHVLLDAGNCVIGYDKNLSDTVRTLQSRGVKVFQSPEEILNSSHSLGIEVTVHSSAIKKSPLLEWSKANLIPIQHRSQTMHEWFSQKKSISVAGSHGKTTTTGMVSQILMEQNLDPSIMIGGVTSLMDQRGGRWGNGSYSVYESDESDGTFLNHKADYRLLINIDDDHLDFYKTRENLMKAFGDYISFNSDATVIVYADDPGIRSLLETTKYKKHIIAVGKNLDPNEFKKVYKLIFENQNAVLLFNDEKIVYQVPFLGDHYLINASLAICLSVELGLDISQTVKSISNYRGVQRRMERIFRDEMKTIIDDYGHHPTEVEAVLAGIQHVKRSSASSEKSDITCQTIVLFQPHRFTRTANLYKEFARSLAKVDQVYLLPIYSAGEEPIEGVSTELIVEELRKLGKESKILTGNREKDVSYLSEKLPNSYILVTLGAGDVREWGIDLANLIK